MADIRGHPFLEILLYRMVKNGVARSILATGHLHELIEEHFGNRWRGMEIRYSVENHPLGTGGAVWKALKMASESDVFVCNGDTFFDVDMAAFYQFHQDMKADVSLALKPMHNIDRYGTVELKNGQITGFREKASVEEGLINGGIYLVNRLALKRFVVPEEFSLEVDFLGKKVAEMTLGGFIHDGYFIDIGIPEDYSRAQIELPLVS
jgi:D-glycero-alpha-D-manno-heptose 1-phosphate guanylyltransferase